MANVNRIDLPCDISFGGCGAGGLASADSCYCVGDLFFGDSKMSTKQKLRNAGIFALVVFALAYVFHGRDIAYVYITDNGSQGVLEQFFERKDPQLRVLALENAEKYYSNVTSLLGKDRETKLILDEPISSFEIDQLQILDARVNIASELIVIGQVLEEYDSPKKSGQGKRFSYRLQRRWHFWE